MNSEELELSLRTEFESYLKDVLAEMKQEVTDFQQKFQDEFEKHKSQLNGVFQEFSSRIENDRHLDVSFKESIVEHLRLSRDEGARITATAIAEAEAMQQEADERNAALATPPVADYSNLRDAIQDISEKDSQSAILKALVNQAGQYTPRGAFFIIKNEHFVGWRVFGKEGETDEQTVREVFFPVSSDTVLGESVRSLSATESTFGTYSEDSLFLNKLEFGQPDKMFAVPLVARNRGVAVLYADHGTESDKVNIEALETLVRVAGMTVELLAASQGVKTRQEEPASASYENELRTPVSYGEEAPVVSNEFKPASETHAFNDGGFKPVNAVDDFTSSYTDTVQEPEPQVTTEIDDFQSAPVGRSFDYVGEKPTFESPNEFQATDHQDHLGDQYTGHQEVQDLSAHQPVVEDVAPSYPWSQPIDASDKFAESAEIEEPPAAKDFAFEHSGAAEDNHIVEDEAAESVPAASDSDFEFTHNQAYEMPAETSSVPVETSEFQSSPQFESNYNNWNSGAVEEQKFEAPSFEATSDYAENKFETPSFESSNNYTENKFESNYESFSAAPVEPAPEPVSAPLPKTRLSERNVDLPIEVAEEERRSHNDARRFARLLVSEIKLYNEQKVKEGREMNDLYDRLREAIDRSREMYDKRVQASVAAKFDYFHYELVNNLAEGNESKLGTNYPGAVN